MPSRVLFAKNSTLSPPSPYCTHWMSPAKSRTVAWRHTIMTIEMMMISHPMMLLMIMMMKMMIY